MYCASQLERFVIELRSSAANDKPFTTKYPLHEGTNYIFLSFERELTNEEYHKFPRLRRWRGKFGCYVWFRNKLSLPRTPRIADCSSTIAGSFSSTCATNR